jgi:hypothetical protein
MARRRVADTLSEIDQRLEQQGMSLLSAEDREQIKAKAKEHVAKKRRDKAEAEALAHAIKEEEREFNIDEQLEDVQINLAPFVASQRFNAAFIAIDGTRYFHGLTYVLPYSVARTIEDIMARGWEHEREIHGERRRADENRRPILGHLSPNNMNINSTASLRRTV